MNKSSGFSPFAWFDTWFNFWYDRSEMHWYRGCHYHCVTRWGRDRIGNSQSVVYIRNIFTRAEIVFVRPAQRSSVYGVIISAISSRRLSHRFPPKIRFVVHFLLWWNVRTVANTRGKPNWTPYPLLVRRGVRRNPLSAGTETFFRRSGGKSSLIAKDERATGRVPGTSRTARPENRERTQQNGRVRPAAARRRRGRLESADFRFATASAAWRKRRVCVCTGVCAVCPTRNAAGTAETQRQWRHNTML